MRWFIGYIKKTWYSKSGGGNCRSSALLKSQEDTKNHMVPKAEREESEDKKLNSGKRINKNGLW